jgi:hypothetical protein
MQEHSATSHHQREQATKAAAHKLCTTLITDKVMSITGYV